MTGSLAKNARGKWGFTDLRDEGSYTAIWGKGDDADDAWFLGPRDSMRLARGVVTHVSVNVDFPYLYQSV